MNMPYMTGEQLAREVISIRPDTPIIVCTGFSEKINENNIQSMGIRGILMKPLVRSDMAKIVRNILDSAEPSREK